MMRPIETDWLESMVKAMPEASNRPLSGTVVLIVDDEPASLKLLADVMISAGYEVRASDDPLLALESALNNPPDLMLLDVRMPVMSGFELCSQLKQDPRTADVPILFVSASVDVEDHVQGFKAGGMDYINKPIRREEVLARVSTHLDLSRKTRELAEARDLLEERVQVRTEELANSEAQFRRLVEKSPDILYRYSDLRGGTYYSPRVEGVLGYTPEYLLEHPQRWHDSIHHDDLAQVDFAISQLFAGKGFDIEYRIRDIKGEWHWFHDRNIEIYRKGEETIVEGLVTEVTRRKQDEDALLLSQRRLEEAQHIGHMGNWELDLETNELTWSKEVYRIFGVDPGNFTPTQEGFLFRVHPDDRENVEECYHRASKRGTPIDVIHRIISPPDDSIRYVNNRMKQQLDEQGQVVRLLGITQDITYRTVAEDAKKQHHQQMQNALRQTVQAIANTVEQRDQYTAGHQQRVADLAAAIAEEMGMSSDYIEGIQLGGVIHDIGKIHIPAELLTRPGKLSETEYRVLQSHVEAGYRIIKDVEFPWPIAELVYQHHERLDGSGYPQGLKGDQICVEAQILMVADVVEAMASHRPYRPALSIDVALAEIERGKGLIFNSLAVTGCLRLFREKGYRIIHYE
ncbi:MAG: HD domain-containing phosphohydrolase [Candidatus Sedimenticola sp. 20ELBAFRAG]